jgi:anthranilate synthase component 1
VKIVLTPTIVSRLSDTVTPVHAYLRVRDRFAGSVLLESADYRGSENSRSYICCEPIASCTIDSERAWIEGKELPSISCQSTDFAGILREFFALFDLKPPKPLPKHVNGAFGYFGYDAVQRMERIRFQSPLGELGPIPQLCFSVFRYVVAIDHFRNEMSILDNLSGQDGSAGIDRIFRILFEGPSLQSSFTPVGEERSCAQDEDFLRLVGTCKKHIQRGDVFQIVPSRRVMRAYSGDEFTLYRVLRSINPSPFLFFFDQGDFSLFGSSPEAQVIIADGRATVFPIAGTYPRTGDDSTDRSRSEALLSDPKENAEHAMLVDLARNDLSRSCRQVRVDAYREVQYYSHVIHLVSKVSGAVDPRHDRFSIISETFPAGTLSGAPKYRAMEILDANEPVRRQFYGGAVGVIEFDERALLAITIRSFLARHGELFYQSGGGITVNSVPEMELGEINAKIAALRRAIETAGAIKVW